MAYVPGQVPSDPKQLAAFLQNELFRIAQEWDNSQNFLRLRELNVEPSKLFDGMLIYADGTNLNLGGGEDLYVRLAGAWMKPGRLTLTSKSAAYGFVLADANNGFLHPSADTTARTWTIPANASVAYPVGTCLTFVNQASAGVISIAITSDTMRLSSAGTTGTRSLAANGIASALKVTSTEWLISGSGLT